MSDEIVEEVRRVREKICAEHDNDIGKLCDWLRRLEEEHPERMAKNLPTGHPEPAAAPADTNAAGNG